MVLGNKYLVILDMESGAGASTRWLSLVDFSTWTEVNILTVTASSNAIPPPIVNPSQGNASVFPGIQSGRHPAHQRRHPSER